LKEAVAEWIPKQAASVRDEFIQGASTGH